MSFRVFEFSDKKKKITLNIFLFFKNELIHGKFLQFLVPPRIVPFKFEEPIFAGQSAQVTCLVSEGDLPLNITWTYEGSSSRSISEMNISISSFGQKTSMLYIEFLDESHRGNYTCIAQSLSNLRLYSHYSAELNIRGNSTKYIRSFYA